MNIKSFTVGEIMSRCYLVSKNKKAFVIDPGDEGEKIYNYLEKNNLKLEFIINTHGHFDHLGANKFLKEKTDAKIYAHPKAEIKFKDPEKNLSQLFYNKKITSPLGDRYLKDEEIIDFEGVELKVIYTPGHSEDGISIFIKKDSILFSGDCIFATSIGRTDLADSNHALLKDSIENKLFCLDDQTRVYPGHGMDFDLLYFKENVWPQFS